MAKIGADGWSLAEATVPGIPLPLPQSGIEVLWNAKMKYAGVALDMKALWVMLSPRSGGSDWIEAGSCRPITTPWGERLEQAQRARRRSSTTPTSTTSPTALARPGAGDHLVPEQRPATPTASPASAACAVCRAFEYDNPPQVGFENQYIASMSRASSAARPTASTGSWWARRKCSSATAASACTTPAPTAAGGDARRRG